MDEKLINLIKKAQNGDKQALSELIKMEQNNIYTTLFYLKKDDNELMDILQNVLIKLSQKIGQLKNPKYFKTWLNQIIVNSYYDYLRKNKKNYDALIKPKNLNDDDKKEENEVADETFNPQNRILYSELDCIIKTSIENLPIHYKIPITLREIQGLSYDEISNITKTSVGTVKSRIARARAKIKDDIDKYAKE